MKIDDICEGMIIEARIVWKKSGNMVKRAYRCTRGPRQGRIVSTAAQCSKPIDIKKRFNFKKTKERLGTRMVLKTRRTKKINPASRRLRMLNKRKRR